MLIRCAIRIIVVLFLGISSGCAQNLCTSNTASLATVISNGVNCPNYSGILIGPNYVLAPAHCISPFGQTMVVLGGNDPSSQQTILVAQVAIFPSYSPFIGLDDIAILQLAQSATFNNEVAPIDVASVVQNSNYLNWIVGITEIVPTGSAQGNAAVPLYQCPARCPGSDAAANIFVNGLEYDSSPTEVCLFNLGTYSSTTGLLIGDNFDASLSAYVLKGKYLETDLVSLTPPLTRFYANWNDFRLTPTGLIPADARQNALWSAEMHVYYYINKFRVDLINDSFINSLSLSPIATTAVNTAQYRSNLLGLVNSRLPHAIVNEGSLTSSWVNNSAANDMTATVEQRSTISAPLDGLAFDPEYVVAQYAGLMSSWITAGTAQWPNDPTWGSVGNFSWQTDIRPAILEGFKVWNAYVYSGHNEVFRYAMRSRRRVANYTCATTSVPPCNKGWKIDNAMMYLDSANPQLNNPNNPSWPASNSDDTLLFPFNVRSGVGTNHFGPSGAELGGIFIAAVFYDISHQVGLGDYKTNQLFWKTVSQIDPAVAISMTAFAQQVQIAARALFPSTTNPALSWYEQDLVDVFTSRGVRMNGVADFRTNLPAVIGTVANPGPGTLGTASTSGFGSASPESQRNSATGYNFLNFFINNYTVNTPGTQYVTYQFYKYSQYGPSDSLELTNGTMNLLSANNPALSYDGSLSRVFKNRELGNAIILSPGNTISWNRKRQSAVSETSGYYVEDVRPVGFRVIKAIPNGFTFKVTSLPPVITGKLTYQLDIMDPSVTLTGPNTGAASYNWIFTDYDGLTTNSSGAQVIYNAWPDQPFTLYVERIRGGQNDNMTLRESGSNFGRNEGNQFNINHWNAGYKTGFDYILDARYVEGHGAYNAALDFAGNASGVQAHRWTTPSYNVRPDRLSTVSVGLVSGTNVGNVFQYQDAFYYNACIWANQANVNASPGCQNVSSIGDYEVQVPFSQSGIDLSQIFASVTTAQLPAYLWTVDLPSSWLLTANTEYYFGGHISASVGSNGYAYNVCSYIPAPGIAGQPSDVSDWLAGQNWSGLFGLPPPQSMRQFLASPNSVPNCTFAAYRFEGTTVP